jgi:hypothetical protein
MLPRHLGGGHNIEARPIALKRLVSAAKEFGGSPVLFERLIELEVIPTPLMAESWRYLLSETLTSLTLSVCVHEQPNGDDCQITLAPDLFTSLSNSCPNLKHLELIGCQEAADRHDQLKWFQSWVAGLVRIESLALEWSLHWNCLVLLPQMLALTELRLAGFLSPPSSASLLTFPSVRKLTISASWDDVPQALLSHRFIFPLLETLNIASIKPEIVLSISPSVHSPALASLRLIQNRPFLLTTTEGFSPRILAAMQGPNLTHIMLRSSLNDGTGILDIIRCPSLRSAELSFSAPLCFTSHQMTLFAEAHPALTDLDLGPCVEWIYSPALSGPFPPYTTILGLSLHCRNLTSLTVPLDFQSRPSDLDEVLGSTSVMDHGLRYLYVDCVPVIGGIGLGEFLAKIFPKLECFGHSPCSARQGLDAEAIKSVLNEFRKHQPVFVD